MWNVLIVQWCPTLCNPMDLPLPWPWNSPGKNTGVGSHSLLQPIFLTQGLNPGLLHCRQIPYHLSLSWPLLIPKYHIRHILILAFITILKFIIQLAITLYEGLKTTPIWFFSINLISVLALHSLLRKCCYHTWDLILHAWPHNGMLIGNQLVRLRRLGSFWVLKVKSSWKYLEPCVCFGTLADVWIGGKQARDEQISWNIFICF